VVWLVGLWYFLKTCPSTNPPEGADYGDSLLIYPCFEALPVAVAMSLNEA